MCGITACTFVCSSAICFLIVCFVPLTAPLSVCIVFVSYFPFCGMYSKNVGIQCALGLHFNLCNIPHVTTILHAQFGSVKGWPIPVGKFIFY